MTDESLLNGGRGPELSDPVFVCGALRSGTTMLRLMLDHHPELSNFGETDFLFEYPLDEKGEPDAAAFKEKLANDGLFADSGLKIPAADNVHDMIRDLTCQMRKTGVMLTINIHRHFERIPATFPNSKIVHLLRDPRDVARSSIGMGWNGNTYFGVNHWIASEQSIEAMRAQFPQTEVLTIKNEDLVRDPEVVLTRICAFVGAPYNPQMLDYHLGTTYEAPDPSLVDQWRTKLSEDELGLLEGKVGDMMEARGYSLSGAPIIIPDEVEKERLIRENRWGRFRTTLKRYGVFLTFTDLAGRRFGLSGLQKFAAKRINKKHKDYLK